MTKEEILAVLRLVPDIGQVKHPDFIDYVVVIKSWRGKGSERRQVESAYMAVDGKIAMACLDHRLQGKRLDFQDAQVLKDTPDELTLAVPIISGIYGRRCGIATSHLKDGTPAEMSSPWEVAQTSAIGRGLSAMGYGLLPGADLASAEDMQRVAPTDFWKAVRTANLTTEQGRMLLAEVGGDFAEAMTRIEKGERPERIKKEQGAASPSAPVSDVGEVTAGTVATSGIMVDAWTSARVEMKACLSRASRALKSQFDDAPAPSRLGVFISLLEGPEENDGLALPEGSHKELPSALLYDDAQKVIPSSTMLTMGQIVAIEWCLGRKYGKAANMTASWTDQPAARAKALAILRDWQKQRGQQEMPLEA